MTTSLRYKGRLPGVVVNTALPPVEAPLRLDVAGFVGFAERGPLNTPVALEDISQYEAVFGGDLAVARDGGRPVYAALPAAVRGFFDNGGRRCYAVRVAGPAARACRFRLPGLVALQADGALAPAIVTAAWVGRWSEQLAVWTRLRAFPLRRVAGPAAPAGQPGEREIVLDLPSAAAVRPGDLLRLRYGAGDPAVYFPVAAVAARRALAGVGRGLPVAVSAPVDSLRALAPAILPDPRAEFAPLSAGLQALPAGEPAAVELLRFELRVRVGEATSERFEELSFGPGAAGWAGRMCAWADDSPAGPPDLPPGRSALLRAPAGEPSALYLPLGMEDLPAADAFAGPLAGGASDGLESFDPVALFLDPRLADLLIGTLMPEAERLLYLSVPPARLTRLHSLIPVEEVALVAIPDLVQPGWPATTLPPPVDPPPPPLPPPLPPDWSQFQGCAQPPPPALAPDEVVRRFYGFLLPLTAGSAAAGLDASARALLTADLRATLADVDLPAALEADEPAVGFAVNLPPCGDVAAERITIQGTLTLASEIELRTDFELLLGEGGWAIDKISSRLAPTVPSETLRRLAQLPQVRPPAEYDLDGLVRVQAALIRLCAARADMTAVLSLPERFGRREAADWRQRLDGVVERPAELPLSYAAAYHPWLRQREGVTPALAPLRAIPPEGPVCGMIAARELARGAWITAAGVPLRGVVGLAPALSDAEAGELFDAPLQINVVRQQPGAFVVISAHTLSPERIYWQVAVRRLLILLRKFALRRGTRYVFESNNERFRRLVQGEFERLLGQLAARGALAAYQVVTGEGLNTQNDIDNGRFLIALKVAPIAPIEFITVMLLRSGEGLLDVLER